MADELISFTMSFQGRETPFSFKKMTAETAAIIVSRLKARSNYYEVIEREIKRAEQTRIEDRDEHSYMALLEKRESVRIQVGKAIEPIFALIATPSKEELLKIMEDEKASKEFIPVIERYFKELFPTEEDRKKS